MLDQLGFPDQSHWYALVSVAPRPETHEAANVAVVFGNGRAYHLAYLNHLPRLCGIAAADEIRVYESILEHCAKAIRTGIEPVELKGILGAQMALRPPTALYAEPTAEMMDRISARFLSAPKAIHRPNEEAIARISTQHLDRVLDRIDHHGIPVDTDVRPNKMYGDKIERHIKGHRVPRLARALRGFGRDVLIDSLQIEPSYAARDVREVSGRIAEAFYLYERYLRQVIRARANRDIRLVGVLHPIPDDSPQHVRDLRDFAGDSWIHHNAIVIDGSATAIETGLREQANWVREATA